MRQLFRSVLALSVLVLPIALHADTFVGTAAFSDTSAAKNNDFNFTGSFENPSFNFTGGVGTMYTDELTIMVGNVNCTTRNPCGSSTTDALSVTVDFSKPNVANSGFSGTGNDFFTFSGFVENSTINWSTNSQTVNFADGSSVLLTLPNFTISNSVFSENDMAGSEDLTIKVLSVPSAATPEPSSLMLLGTGVLGAAGAIRRRIKA